jgi:hypothetical protein
MPRQASSLLRVRGFTCCHVSIPALRCLFAAVTHAPLTLVHCTQTHVFLGDLGLKQGFQSKLRAPQLFGVAPSERLLDLFEKSLRIVVRLKFKKFGWGNIE